MGSPPLSLVPGADCQGPRLPPAGPGAGLGVLGVPPPHGGRLLGPLLLSCRSNQPRGFQGASGLANPLTGMCVCVCVRVPSEHTDRQTPVKRCPGSPPASTLRHCPLLTGTQRCVSRLDPGVLRPGRLWGAGRRPGRRWREESVRQQEGQGKFWRGRPELGESGKAPMAAVNLAPHPGPSHRPPGEPPHSPSLDRPSQLQP